ncbi:bifunctional demethylmenaquinone methyltransferase/2-methoxy-6-polyprenyl-1,4-benzoquinol methylase UbiE [Salaquimonas pukyongi]|uniref:bifunctional demethylmenaquinone methyltransferase/2-methoxy-6-polyprenyl-1,4-benzoquinol methylase UbiE n=1 Tax=Salaquimonas pukyongi TaxID=2712698 RepID=UPI00096BC42F|nr:bifunctional demethylmenaquinone methyltransferase/2-methoxy-6-polyprenyl-1,4-benzoquinol methylase UbiE [Salaquimonas pukyongi]
MPVQNTKTRSKSAEELSASFGFAEVVSDEKQPLVNDVFHKVAGRYDMMNDLMSGGMHRVWKDAMIARLAPPRKPGTPWHLLDVAGGTGDIAFGVVEAANRNVRATVLDINASMLEVGRKRAVGRKLDGHVEFVEADAQKLPFEDNAFDAYTIAFGIRNVPHIDLALAEAWRVLKRGGRFLCLEFSEVEVPVLDRLYDEWSMRVIPQIGKAVAGDDEPYRYLVESVRKFPSQRNFAAMIAGAGFSRVDWSDFSGGIAALHSGWKL